MKRGRVGDKSHLFLQGYTKILNGHFPTFEYLEILLFLQYEILKKRVIFMSRTKPKTGLLSLTALGSYVLGDSGQDL